MAKIALFDAKPYDQTSFKGVNQKYDYDITYFEPRLNEVTADLAHGHEIVCAFVNDTLNKEVIEKLYANGTRLIVMRCAGYNNVDMQVAYGKMHVARVPAYSPHAVAEHTIALLMGLNRKIYRAYTRTREGNFALNGLLGFDMFGKTVGVVGTGRIGRCLIDILKGFGMNVLAYDLYPDEEYAKEKDIEYVSLDDLYRKSDVINLTCPLTKDTYHMINRFSIGMMKPGVFIVNTGRGGLINTKDLIDGLKHGNIGAAGLDVYEEEGDYFFEDHSIDLIQDDVLARLMSFPNVLITSHQAFFTKEALTAIAETTLFNVAQYLKDEVLKNEICYQCDQVCKNDENKEKRCFKL
jgi:D-lactate dehydrogenase